MRGAKLNKNKGQLFKNKPHKHGPIHKLFIKYLNCSDKLIITPQVKKNYPPFEKRPQKIVHLLLSSDIKLYIKVDY